MSAAPTEQARPGCLLCLLQTSASMYQTFEWKGKADPKAAISAWQAFLKADPNSPKRAQVEQMIAQAKKHLSIPAGTKTEKPAM